MREPPMAAPVSSETRPSPLLIFPTSLAEKPSLMRKTEVMVPA